jgi:predicted hydrolase (HD superfamily)
MKTRDEAFALLREYTKSESLIRHALCVEASMEWYANHFAQAPEEVLKWKITGLVHDFDYEQFPEPVPPDGHPYKGNAILRGLGYPDDICEAIMGHATYSGVPRATLMAKTLFAVDELSGLVYAASLVRPDKSLQNLEAKSVMKKMKDKAFARGCNREDITVGAHELGVELPRHVENVLTALQQADLTVRQEL